MSDAKDRIAIVGMAGRFPGAPDVEQFWQLLKGGVEGIRFFTPEELAAAGVPETLLRNPDFVPANGYLDDVELFDAPFFGMTAREAEMTDPQHRLFLQSSWHALEDAGHVPERFDGRIGVYAGCGWSTYLLFHLFRNPDLPPSVSHLQYLIGNSGDYLPTRVSYRLNLKGPSVNVNTACSSSLVAVHMACQSLLDYECDMALAGGASVQLPQDQGYVHQENTITSPDGHCRAFDAKAAGTVSGNGVGLVVLRRLEDALADGDTIRAVILGSAINNDGADKAGYTAPSISGQAIVVAEAMSVGSVEPDTIQYIETHGTGTQIGDPIEIQALSRVFGSGDRAASCALGSLKTNIGHLDEAAGVAGLMKTVLAMERGQIPPSLHFESPNPETDLENSPFHVNAHLRPWPATDGPRRAGVSSFGIGGTNAHIVLEQAPVGIQPSASRRPAIVPVSARSASALTQARRQLADHLEANPELAPAAVASTLQIGRQAFGWRSAVCGDTLEEIVRELRVDRRPAGIADTGVPVAFLFPGQGSQHPEMAAELYETEPFFRDELDHCCELLRQHAPQESLSFLQPATATSSQALTRTDSAQPALFVVEVALARLWMHWGVKPDYLIGHSLGEYVAACLADVFSLEEAIRIISARGRLMQSMPDGAMLAVPLVEAEAMAYLRPQLDVAAINTSDQTIVSGSEDQIVALEQRLNADGISGRRLATSHAFHSHMMDPVLAPFEEVMRGVALGEPRIPIISNTTGEPLSAQQAMDPSYWTAHLRGTVRFSAGIDFLVQQGCGILLEVGPSNVLSRIADRLTKDVAVVTSLPNPRQNSTDGDTLAQAIGQVWTRGIDVDWNARGAGETVRRVSLPGYPFARERHWIDRSDLASVPDEPQPQPQPQPAKAIEDWFYAPQWHVEPGRTDETWRPDHCLLFDDGSALGESVCGDLEAMGTRVTSVQPGDGQGRLRDGRGTLRPSAPDDYATLVEALDTVPDLVVHLWGLCSDQKADTLEHGFHSLLCLAQSLADRTIDLRGRWVAFTSPCYEVTGTEELTPLHATVSGLSAVVPLEFPNLQCHHVDLEINDIQAAVGQIRHEIGVVASSNLTVWRKGQRWIREWIPQSLPIPQRPMAIRDGGTYLITGGLGSMGLAFAEYMSQQAQCRLVLTGRSPFRVKETGASLSQPGTSTGRDPADDAIAGLTRDAAGLAGQISAITYEAEQRLDITTLGQIPELASLIEELSASLVYHRLFAGLAEGEQTWTRHTCMSKLSTLPIYECLFNALLDLLIDDGIVHAREGQLYFTEPPRSPDALLQLLADRYPAYTGIGRMLSHCTERLSEVVSGSVAPLEVLYPDGTDRLLTEHFADVPPHANDRIYLHVVGQLIRDAARVAPAGRPLRILEVGGGTGELSQVVLEALGDRSVDYTFTDLGSSFVERARQASSERGYQDVHFSVLDISKDPTRQGLDRASFDIIIGYNVVHATPDIRASVQNLAHLLVPEGVILLVETVIASRLDLLIWGLTEGWWVYDDVGLRTRTPILSLDEWDRALETEELDVMTFPRTSEDRATTSAGLIIARARQTKASSLLGHRPADSEPRRTIDRIETIEQAGSVVEYVQVDVANQDDMDRLCDHLQSTTGELDGIVHTAGELGQGIIRLKSRQDIDRTFAPKIHAADGLDKLLSSFNPSFLLLCSSMSSIAPIVGQADYAAANAFLDAYAFSADRQFETRVVSITWGFWQELGMIAKARGDLTQQEDLIAQIKRSGLANAGISAFERILENPSPAQVVVTPESLAGPVSQPAPSHHPWFDRVVPFSDEGVYVEGTVSPDSAWVLDEHRVLGKSVLPGTAYLEMARAAACEVSGSATIELRNVYFLRPLVVEDATTTELRTVLQKREHGWDFSILSRTGVIGSDSWLEHTRGEIHDISQAVPGGDMPDEMAGPVIDLKAIRTNCEGDAIRTGSSPADLQTFEDSMSAFGPHWHNLVEARFGTDQAFGEFKLKDVYASELTLIQLHPALLDNATGFLKVRQETESAVPFSYRSIRILGSLPAHVYSHIRKRNSSDDGSVSYDLTIADPAGRVIVDIEAYTMRTVRGGGATSRLFAEVDPENAALTLHQPGSLSTFFLTPEVRQPLADDEVEIEVKATGLNFIEVLFSLEMLPDLVEGRFPYGLECAGIVSRCGAQVGRFQVGDEVVAFTNGCYKAFAVAASRTVAPKPATLSMAQAATIPAAYMTAWHALTGPGRLVAGERILIHSAAGGVGLAAVHVARWLGAEVLATAGTEEKRAYLQSIGVDYVTDSRRSGFGQQVMVATDGQGVDVVLNSLGQEFTGESMSTLARYGRFVELGKRGMFENADLDLAPFQRQLTFTAVDVGPDLPNFEEIWRQLIEHIDAERLPPLPCRTFPSTEPGEGFAYMARGQHIGKIVFTFGPPEDLIKSTSSPDTEGRSFASIVGHPTDDATDQIPSEAYARSAPTSLSPGDDVLTDAEEASSTEEAVAQIWAELLGAPSLRREDDFFDLNGDSLLAAQVISQVHGELGVKLPFSAIFDAPTLQQLAQEIDQVLGTLSDAADDDREEGII